MSSSNRQAPSRWQSAWRRLLDNEPRTHPLWLRWSAAVALTLLAVWLRLQISSPESGARFATLSLAVTVSTLFGGVSSGLISTALAMLLANFAMIAPLGQMAVSNPVEAFWLNLTFLITQLVVIGAIWVMQQRNRRMHDLKRELTSSQKKFLDTFEHAAAGITHVGLGGELLAVNQTFCQLVGYSEAELRQLTFQDITHPDDIADDVGLLHQAVQGLRTQYTLEKRYIHRQGHQIWAQVTVALMLKAQGQPDYFISVVQDISAVKATEEALRTSERLMQRAQAVGALLTWECDIAEQRFRTFGKIYPWLDPSANQFEAEGILAKVHPDDHVRLKAEWAQAIKGRGNYQGLYRGRPGSRIQWFTVTADFERDERGRALRALGVTQDVSKQKLAELEIKHLNASLEQRIQDRTHELKDAYNELESYSYAVAHDLRSPLRIINGFAQALQEDNPALNESSVTHLQRIRNASQKMGQLIDGLLTLSQYARGQVTRHPVNLSVVATRLLEEMASDEPHRNVDWQVEPGLLIQADPPLIEALMQNLLGNAWKYTMRTTEARIRVYSEVDAQGQPRYCVSDNGAGFDMAHAGKLFQPFQRLHMPHEFAGLGVGLATARRIVVRHSGELSAVGEPGRGAQFGFTLPSAPSAADHPAP
ncbi:PAS domain S-box protein [Hydrogenophaga sp. PAMC20947]|uniref:PAS domain S-box protein n=1 Tax=Hydrogenophaga sp. PAMC20947 TaxID=2565558 RepID=UPI00109DF26A|nr:PAS domain S-box protein [Hydrogenophaga sp. PAMC20947]QCB46261.1 PAS domain S-box protein [Hydrogenophaga sp. PAMC20947]